MPKINVLPKHVADLIAAGEVVERPSSVIKELVENSIDAGASSVTVEIRRGGITYMRVTDNGCGIRREDIRNAFKSHATSKILNEEDLHAIGTLGFRGEALASIAAVAKVDVLTRTPDEDIGTVYKIAGSEEQALDDAGCPLGTTIVVRDLFYNTPARMKFLKRDVTEGNSVAGVVDRLAMSHPEVAIRFIRDDRQQLATTGNGKLTSAVYSVFGREFASGLLPTEYELKGVKVDGLVSKPTASRRNRSMQFFYLNGRLVKSRTATAALEQAYKGAIMVGKFPACVLNIHIPLETVDVNVHPAKTEVRFSDEKLVFDAVYYAAKNAIEKKDVPNRLELTKQELRTQNPEPKTAGDQLSMKEYPDKLPQRVEDFWQSGKASEWRKEVNRPKGKGKKKSVSIDIPYEEEKPRSHTESKIAQTEKKFGDTAKEVPKASVHPETKKKETAEKPCHAPTPYIRKDDRMTASVVQEGKNRVSVARPLEEHTPKKEEAPKPYAEQTEVPDFRIIGEAFKTYIIFESEGKITLVDKHAAQERIYYDKLLRERESVKSQLVMPVSVTLSKEEYSVLLENRELLLEAGYNIDDFGGGTIVVREIPVMLIGSDVTALIQEIAGQLLEDRSPQPEKLKWIYANTACRAAIKAGDDTPPAMQRALVEYLLSHRDVRYCPHGRPICIEMTRTELEKGFGRIQK